MRAHRLSLLLLPLLVACPAEVGECEVDADCPDGRRCRSQIQGGNVCIEVLPDGPVDPPEEPVRIVSFTVSPGIVARGEEVTLAWESEHATSCAIDPDIGFVPSSGTRTVVLLDTTRFLLACQGADGPALLAETGFVEATILAFDASATSLNEGDPSTLSWRTAGTETCFLYEGEAAFHTLSPEEIAEGEHSRPFSRSATISLRCLGISGPTEAALSIDVASIRSFSASPPALAAGQETTLAWEVEHATSCRLPGVEEAPEGSSVRVALASSRTVSLVCRGFSEAVLQRDLLVPVLILSFTADDESVPPGGGTTLRFSIDPTVASCRVNDTDVDLAAGAHAVEGLSSDTDFVLVCQSVDGLVATSDALRIRVE